MKRKKAWNDEKYSMDGNPAVTENFYFQIQL
jgi:hypothetical protein